jgi:hypothetical protein
MKVKTVLYSLFMLFAAIGQPIFAAESPAQISTEMELQSRSKHSIKHNIQLQVTDFLGVPVENTEFWITLDLVKQGDQVTVHLPTINFQIGQCAAIDADCTPPSVGYVVTATGFLPKDFRPSSLVPVAIVAASDNGLPQTSSFADTPTPPQPGFIVQITNTGSVQILAAGSNQNAIDVGPQIVAPCSITYLAGKREVICENFQLSNGFIDVNQFTGATPHGTPAGDNIRDSHINDVYNGKVVWAYTANNNVSYTANLLNVFVVVGEVDSRGHVKYGDPIQINDFPVNTIAWDTSVAINRTDSNNIVVTYELIPYDFSNTYFDGNIIGPDVRTCRAVSFDGGKTWGGVFDGSNSLPYNGPLNYQAPGGEGTGDYPGVGADQYGNFWIGSTANADALGNSVNQPYLLISSDQGVTWQLAFNSPPVANPQPPAGPGGTDGDSYDYPHLCFGGNGTSYGVWYYSDYIVSEDILGDLYPCVTFIPITGLGTYGTPTTTFLNSFPNSIGTPTIAASMDGRFWAFGDSNYTSDLYDISLVTLFKTPGPLNQNYAGPWLNGFANGLNFLGIYPYASVPFYGYLFPTVQGLIYDENREALYALFSARAPELSQNMRLYFSISRNNGQTWSEPYDISSTAFANRGFISMALDNKTGSILLGWYDGRKDKTLQRLQYWGGIIKSKVLNCLVEKIPLSDPLIFTGPQGSPTPPDGHLP